MAGLARTLRDGISTAAAIQGYSIAAYTPRGHSGQETKGRREVHLGSELSELKGVSGGVAGETLTARVWMSISKSRPGATARKSRLVFILEPQRRRIQKFRLRNRIHVMSDVHRTGSRLHHWVRNSASQNANYSTSCRDPASCSGDERDIEVAFVSQSNTQVLRTPGLHRQKNCCRSLSEPIKVRDNFGDIFSLPCLPGQPQPVSRYFCPSAGWHTVAAAPGLDFIHVGRRLDCPVKVSFYEVRGSLRAWITTSSARTGKIRQRGGPQTLVAVRILVSRLAWQPGQPCRPWSDSP